MTDALDRVGLALEALHLPMRGSTATCPSCRTARARPLDLRVRLRCAVGCEEAAILDALDLTRADLEQRRPNDWSFARRGR